jgi:hypothetical protein
MKVRATMYLYARNEAHALRRRPAAAPMEVACRRASAVWHAPATVASALVVEDVGEVVCEDFAGGLARLTAMVDEHEHEGVHNAQRDDRQPRAQGEHREHRLSVCTRHHAPHALA